MITLRTNPYSEKEKVMLASVFATMEAVLMKKVCEHLDYCCKGCEYRHLCYDITNAREHAEKLLTE